MRHGLASASWSPWISIPAQILIMVAVCALMGCGIYVLVRSADDEEYRYPKWVGALLMTLAFLSAGASHGIWEEERVIAAFAENLAASALFFLGPVGAIVAGYLVYRKWSRLWLACLAGIAVGLVLAAGIFAVSSRIPGVGWRVEKIAERMPTADDVDY